MRPRLIALAGAALGVLLVQTLIFSLAVDLVTSCALVAIGVLAGRWSR